LLKIYLFQMDPLPAVLPGGVETPAEGGEWRAEVEIDDDGLLTAVVADRETDLGCEPWGTRRCQPASRTPNLTGEDIDVMVTLSGPQGG
jgi:hypothetical protein